MTLSQVPTLGERSATDGDRRDAVERCRVLLAREGFAVWVVAPSDGRSGRSPELLAENGARVLRVFVLLDRDVDAPGTRSRIRASLREGETRVCVPWPLRWRMLSNLDRWGLSGVSVAGV